MRERVDDKDTEREGNNERASRGEKERERDTGGPRVHSKKVKWRN